MKFNFYRKTYLNGLALILFLFASACTSLEENSSRLKSSPTDKQEKNQSIKTRLTNPSPTRVLFLGNSYLYYNDSLHNHVKRLVSDLNPEIGKTLKYKSATIGGSTLSHHDLDSHLELGKLGLDEPFELVILQGGSSDALSEKSRSAFDIKAKEFDQKIRAQGGETALYMVHAYVKPHKRYDPNMIRKVEDMYVETGRDINALVIPVGLAFERAYAKRPSIQLHKEFDGTHPSLLGTYLAACVVYASLYKKNPVGSNYDYFGKINKQDAEFLQQIAYETTLEFLNNRMP